MMLEELRAARLLHRRQQAGFQARLHRYRRMGLLHLDSPFCFVAGISALIS
jgi:hypothetical protein